MTLRHLRIFCAVLEQGSMSAAAQSLFMTQPSVSQAIRELEQHYGCVLFERMGRRLAVTPAGDRLYPRARALVEQFEELEQAQSREGQRQLLRIGANLTVGSALLHDYLARLEQRCPGAEIQVYVSRSADLIRRLNENRLDMALTEALSDQPDYFQIPFCQDRILAAAHPEHPVFQLQSVTPEALAAQRLLLRERGAGVREQFQRLMEARGLACKPYWESVSSTVLIHAAQRKEGVAILPYQLTREALEAHPDLLREVPVAELDFHRQLVLICHRKKYISRMMSLLAEIVLGTPLEAAIEQL
ncbi:MAG: LysR family transcriptional regulator [Candidatus Onthomonas sp.]